MIGVVRAEEQPPRPVSSGAIQTEPELGLRREGDLS
jgi:hypothetical protein